MMVHELEPFDMELCSAETMSRLCCAWKFEYPFLQVLEEFVPVYHD